MAAEKQFEGERETYLPVVNPDGTAFRQNGQSLFCRQSDGTFVFLESGDGAVAGTSYGNDTTTADTPSVEDGEDGEKDADDAFWSIADCKKLIAVYAEVRSMYVGTAKKKAAMWKEVSKQMDKVQFSASVCDHKWRNLLVTYRKIKRRRAQSGESGGRLWPLYHLIDDIEGNTASSIGITKSCEHRAASTAVGESSISTDSAPAETTATAAATPLKKPAKRRRSNQPPSWFEAYVDEQRKWQESCRAERRDQFAVLERQNEERLSLMKQLVEAVCPGSSSSTPP